MQPAAARSVANFGESGMSSRHAVVALSSISLISACDSPEALMASMERDGIAQRDCVASTWFADQRPDLYSGASGSSGSVLIATTEVASACSKSRRLVEELRLDGGLFRRYRCRVGNQDVEVSFSAAKNDRDEGLFSWCEFAFGGPEPFEDETRYTEFRER